jgi:hypothetical protein
MGTFDYPPPLNDVKFISVVPYQPKAVIFQVDSFQKSCFNDPWNLPSPSSLMEGVGNLGMDVTLPYTKVAFNIPKNLEQP